MARARTFGFMKDVSKLWSAGYALGASLENTLVVGDDRLLNPEGLRYADEFVRHKALDAIGDLALAGAPILGAYKSVCGGHKLNHAVLCALIARPDRLDGGRGEAFRGGAAMPTCATHVPAYRADLSVATFRVNSEPATFPGECPLGAIIAWRIEPGLG